MANQQHQIEYADEDFTVAIYNPIVGGEGGNKDFVEIEFFGEPLVRIRMSAKKYEELEERVKGFGEEQ